MKPVITDKSNGYVLTWQDYGISVTVNRLQVHKSDGRVSGEILIDALNGDGNPVTIYPPTSYNFSTNRTRKELANSLKEKNPKIPWADIVDQLCYGVQDRARKGEPVQELFTSDDILPPEYFLEPVIIKNYPNVIFGDPSSAKSTLAVILTQVLMLPWHDNPIGLIAPKKPVSVLYLDWETDANTIQWQTTMLERGLGMGTLSIKYRHCSQPLVFDAEEIKAHIVNNSSEVIIIDSLGLAAGGELKETQSALSFFASLRELKVTSLILAHNSKDREAKTRSIYGNQYFTAQARNIWEIRTVQEYDSNEMDIALFHRKPPPFAGRSKPLGLKIIFDNDKMNIEPREPRNISEFLEQMGTKQRIIELLKGGALSNTEIKEALEITKSNTDVTIKRLKDRGQIVKVNNKWGLSLQ